MHNYKLKIIFIILAVLIIAFGFSLKNNAKAEGLAISAEDFNIEADQTVTVAWDTNIEASCSITYSRSSDLSNGVIVNGVVTEVASENNNWRFKYLVNVEGLNDNSNYYYKVDCTVGSISASSNIYTLNEFDIERDLTLSIDENAVEEDSTASITWNTNIEASCKVNLSQESDLSDSTKIWGELSDEGFSDYFYYEAKAENLEVNTYYYYNLVCIIGDETLTSEVQTLDMYEIEENLTLSVGENVISSDLTASIYWETNLEADCEFRFNSNYDELEGSTGISGSIIQYPTEDNDGKYHYYLKLEALNSDTSYFYKVTCAVGGDVKESEIKTLASQSGDSDDDTPDDVNMDDEMIEEEETIDEISEDILSTLEYYDNITVSNIDLVHLAGDAIKITWDTNVRTSYNLVYLEDLEMDMGRNYNEEIEYKENHEVIIKDMIKNHAYKYHVFSRLYDGSSIEAQSDYSDVTTMGELDYIGEGGGEVDISLSEAEKEDFALEGKAILISNYILAPILAELQELRDVAKEEENKAKYLTVLKEGITGLTEIIEAAINSFITYGIDSNTKKLGAGERAAVIYSFKAAFDKLPETEAEITDVIRIANGRWPNSRSDGAEKMAREQFRKIYKRIADLNEPYDDAAITVMAYGLRQKAENRNLDSERSGIGTFRDIYGYHPNSTEDWNIMQAITYSGAARGVDSDGDFLTDEREVEFGTDSNNPDSDGDGHIDGIEVENNYNPLGSGRL